MSWSLVKSGLMYICYFALGKVLPVHLLFCLRKSAAVTSVNFASKSATGTFITLSVKSATRCRYPSLSENSTLCPNFNCLFRELIRKLSVKSRFF